MASGNCRGLRWGKREAGRPCLECESVSAPDLVGSPAPRISVWCKISSRLHSVLTCEAGAAAVLLMRLGVKAWRLMRRSAGA